MEKILITGASGFIGRACIEKLKEMPFEVHTISRTAIPTSAKNIISHACDILNIDDTIALTQKIKADYLLHLAWFVEHPIFWISIQNIPYISASAMLYHAFSTAGGKKAILIGSSAEYTTNTEECHEDKTAILPATLYGLAKKQTCELIERLKLTHPTHAEFCWVRLFNLFGPYENENRLIPYIFNTYLKGKVPIIHNASAVRNYTHIDYIAESLIALLHQPLKGKLNIGSSHEFTLAELAKIIHQRYFQKWAPPHFELSSTSTDRFVPDLTKFKKFSLKTKQTLEEELDRIYLFWHQIAKEHTK